MLQSGNGNHRSSVPTYCTDPSRSTWQRQLAEPASSQRHPVCRRAGLQVAGVAASIWQLAHCIHADEPLVKEWGARPGIRVSANMLKLDRRPQPPDGTTTTASPRSPSLPEKIVQDIMDRAYEGNETRQLALALGFTPVVPPLSTRVDPGSTTGRCTRGGTKSSGCSVG